METDLARFNEIKRIAERRQIHAGADPGWCSSCDAWGRVIELCEPEHRDGIVLDSNELMRECVLEVKLAGWKVMRVKLFIAAFLINLAALVLGCKVEMASQPPK